MTFVAPLDGILAVAERMGDFGQLESGVVSGRAIVNIASVAWRAESCVRSLTGPKCNGPDWRRQVSIAGPQRRVLGQGAMGAPCGGETASRLSRSSRGGGDAGATRG